MSSEIIEIDGRLVRRHDNGALQDVETGRMVGSEQPYISSPQQAAALARRRWTLYEQAKLDGLAAAAADLGLSAADLPAAAVAAVIAARAKIAVSDGGRAGNEAARIILQLVGLISNGRSPQDIDMETTQDKLTFQVQGKLARDVLAAIAARSRSPQPAAQQPAAEQPAADRPTAAQPSPAQPAAQPSRAADA